MGLSGVSMWELLIILLIVVLIFGTSRLKTLGSDLGGAIRSFRQAMDGKGAEPSQRELPQASGAPASESAVGDRHSEGTPQAQGR